MSKTKSLNYYKKSFLLIVILLILSVILSIKYPFLIVIKVVFGSFLILFTPGFFLSYCFFPKSRPFSSETNDLKSLDIIERIILAVFTSLGILAFLLFILRQVNIELTPLLILLAVIGLNIFGLICNLGFKQFNTNSKNN